MSDNKVKQAVESAKGSWWKKALWWSAGILVVGTGIGLLIWALVKRKDPVTAAKDVAEQIEVKLQAVDADAKASAAQAAGAEKEVVEKVREAAKEKDAFKRAQKLAAALGEDY
jgi:hypothetical protein